MVMTAQDTKQKPGYKQTEVGVIPENWEVKKFGEVFHFLNTANNSRSDLSENGDIEYIHYGDIHTKWRSFLDCSSDEIPSIQSDKVRNVPFLEDGDLVMADASEDYEGLGISVEVKKATGKKVIAGLHTLLLRGNKEVLADGFKGYIQYIPDVKDSLRKAATGISVYGISKNNIRNIAIPLPSLPEQRAIASTLSDIDTLITSLDKLIAKKRDIKQATMQQLLTGKTRLPGFSEVLKSRYKQTEIGMIPEDWEVKKLGDVAKIYRGASPRPIDDPKWFNEYSNIGWVRIADATKSAKYLLNTTQYLSEQGVKQSRFVKQENLIMSICATVGKPIITRMDVCIHDGFVIFENPKVNLEYLYYYLSSIENNWSKNGQTGSQMNLNTTIIGNENVSFPKNPKEQTAIATILSDMDAEIAALEQKRDKTRALKQSMMQELLTGKTRLL